MSLSVIGVIRCPTKGAESPSAWKPGSGSVNVLQELVDLALFWDVVVVCHSAMLVQILHQLTHE